ncbi:MAG: histidine phosphatase family protein [Bacilli bacterium]|nr:histidine phosphatase family protein [Bacilli bacterium]
MKIYLVRNLETLSNAYNFLNKKDSDELLREKEILSVTGENHARELSKYSLFKNVDSIYSSNYISTLSTAKYIAKENNIKINVSFNFNDRRLGATDDVDMDLFDYKTYHNFDYKLRLGESINDIKKRASLELKNILKQDYTKVVIVSHEVVLISLLLNWCELGYNCDNDIILTYKDKVVCDTNINPGDVYELYFDGTTLKSLEKINNL